MVVLDWTQFDKSIYIYTSQSSCCKLFDVYDEYWYQICSCIVNLKLILLLQVYYIIWLHIDAYCMFVFELKPEGMHTSDNLETVQTVVFDETYQRHVSRCLPQRILLVDLCSDNIDKEPETNVATLWDDRKSKEKVQLCTYFVQLTQTRSRV